MQYRIQNIFHLNEVQFMDVDRAKSLASFSCFEAYLDSLQTLRPMVVRYLSFFKGPKLSLNELTSFSTANVKEIIVDFQRKELHLSDSKNVDCAVVRQLQDLKGKKLSLRGVQCVDLIVESLFKSRVALKNLSTKRVMDIYI